MPRFIVERTVPEGIRIPLDPAGAKLARTVAEASADGTSWARSYVSEDHHRTYCVYDAPNAEAVRKAAASNGLPIDRITQVRVLDSELYV